MVAITASARRFAIPRRGVVVVAILVAWAILGTILRGQWTLALATSDLTPFHERLDDFRDWVDGQRTSNVFFTGFIDVIRIAVDEFTIALQSLISQPALGRPVPLIGWLGVVALSTLGAYVFAGPGPAALTTGGLVSIGLLGLWRESMDTLALTLAAVLLCLAIGIPLGVWIGLSAPVRRVVTPVLDVMQAMPSFVYLSPLALFFLIGPAAAVITTLIYAVPPVIRLTAHGIAGVDDSALEASRSLGATRGQLLRTVRLPLAKRSIVLGANQTTMAALSMVTIAALINAPGLGSTVLRALSALDVGRAFVAGLAIVILAVVLDRVTTAASVRVERRRRGGAQSARRRRLVVGGLTAAAVGGVYLSYTYYWAALFPGPVGGVIGYSLGDGVNVVADWARLNLHDLTDAVRNIITYGLLNPLQAVLAESPWFVVGAAILGLTWTVAGPRATLVAAACLAALIGTGLWSAAMETLTSTVVATIIVIALGVGIGVWLGRSRRADTVIRPVLDAAQVMPAFVYLVPFVGLFGASRLTAIIAAVVFAAPVAIKIVADGVRAVPVTVVEAATASGSSAGQIIAKVQLPLARRALTLAANQGLIYVLSMVVVGGLVGAGALGYLVVAGFSQSDLYGKGLAAGVAIVVLGVLLDRVTQAATRRAGTTPSTATPRKETEP